MNFVHKTVELSRRNSGGFNVRFYCAQQLLPHSPSCVLSRHICGLRLFAPMDSFCQSLVCTCQTPQGLSIERDHVN